MANNPVVGDNQIEATRLAQGPAQVELTPWETVPVLLDVTPLAQTQAASPPPPLLNQNINIFINGACSLDVFHGGTSYLIIMAIFIVYYLVTV